MFYCQIDPVVMEPNVKNDSKASSRSNYVNIGTISHNPPSSLILTVLVTHLFFSRHNYCPPYQLAYRLEAFFDFFTAMKPPSYAAGIMNRSFVAMTGFQEGFVAGIEDFVAMICPCSPGIEGPLAMMGLRAPSHAQRWFRCSPGFEGFLAMMRSRASSQ
jgi:hypothetical protein